MNIFSDAVLIPTFSPFLDSGQNSRTRDAPRIERNDDQVELSGAWVNCKCKPIYLHRPSFTVQGKTIKRILKGNGWGTRDGEVVVKEIAEQEHRGRAKTVCE